MSEEKNTKEAFLWIIGLLQKHKIPFQISGGFAVRLYGSNRELNDIDIGVPDDAIDILYPDVKVYITYGPDRYVDEEWDLKLMSLKYKGQSIDIAGRDSIKLFDKESGVWIAGHRDFITSELKDVYGLVVPVIPKESLIAYKRKIIREVDIADIEFLTQNKILN